MFGQDYTFKADSTYLKTLESNLKTFESKILQVRAERASVDSLSIQLIGVERYLLNEYTIVLNQIKEERQKLKAKKEE